MGARWPRPLGKVRVRVGRAPPFPKVWPGWEAHGLALTFADLICGIILYYY